MFINSPIHRFTNSPTGDSPNCSVSSDSPIHRFTDSPIDGVTLVELIIVIAIIGIIVLFATIDTGWFQRDARVSEARDRLLADVEDIKIKSLAEVPHAVFFIIVGGTSTSYTVES